MIHLLVAAGHRLFREGLRRLLSDHFDMHVAAEASNCGETIDAVRTNEIDVAIMDLSMPGCSGHDLIANAKSLRPAMRVFAMTMHDEVTQALRAGADGYATKEIGAVEMTVAIRRLHCGGRYLCSEAAERLALSIATHDNGDGRHYRLSDREYKIFEMLVAGKTGREIAAELSVSEKTVSSQKINVLKKMNLANRTELVRYAIRQQLFAE